MRVPARVYWGDRDPWLGVAAADRFAARLGAELEHLDAGHWPWLDRPELLDQLAP
jgi:pimeloyl-ACP methyl ester carboxylesterase